MKFRFSSALSLVVEHLVANQRMRVRFPQSALLAAGIHSLQIVRVEVPTELYSVRTAECIYSLNRLVF